MSNRSSRWDGTYRTNATYGIEGKVLRYLSPEKLWDAGKASLPRAAGFLFRGLRSFRAANFTGSVSQNQLLAQAFLSKLPVVERKNRPVLAALSEGQIDVPWIVS